MPALTASYSGFAAGDNFANSVTGSPSLNTTATPASPPGTYPITAAVGTLAAQNYTFSFVAGTLTIVAQPTVTSITPISAGPTNAASLTFSVVFGQQVFSVSPAAFQLTATGTANGNVASVSASSGTVFTVTVGSIAGDGTLRLDLPASSGVVDSLGNPVAAFTSGGTVTIDHTPPASKVSPLATRQSTLTFTISVTGSDSVAGGVSSGVASYDIYVSDNGQPWTLRQTVPASSPSAQFTGQSNHSYGFYSIAHDAAGNVELKSPLVEGGTYVPDLTPPATSVTSVATATPTFQVSFQGTDTGGSGVASFQVMVSVDGAAATFVGTVAGGTPVAGVYSGSITYQAIADGASHSYRFYTIGADGAGNQETPPAGAA